MNKKKIFYISNSFIPSSQANSIHVMKMCSAYADSGHEVTLISFKNKLKDFTNVSDIHAYYNINKNVRLLRLPWFKLPAIGVFYSLVSALCSVAAGVDIVHCRDLKGCYYSSLFGRKVIYELHHPVKSGNSKILNIPKKLFRSKNLIKVVVITKALKDYLIRNFPETKDKIIVLPDAADPVIDINQKTRYLTNNVTKKYQVGYIGSLYRGRGIDIIIELAKQCSWADFNIVGGNDSEVDYWKSQTENLNNIHFFGFVPPAKAEQLRFEFDVLLSPYQKIIETAAGNDTSRWMSPLKIFEYMSSGKPTVCSDLPVIREVLTHKVNAILVKPDDINGWYKAISQLVNDKEFSDRISKQAYMDFINKYTWEARAKNILNSI